jgi:hypothetical protein
MVIGEGEEVAGTGGDEGNRVERSFARSDDYSPLKRWTQKDGVGVQLDNVWRRVTGGGVLPVLASSHAMRWGGGARQPPGTGRRGAVSVTSKQGIDSIQRCPS